MAARHPRPRTLDRRSFLRVLGAGAAVPTVGALAGCGDGGGGGALGGGGGGGEVTELIVPTASTPWIDAYTTVCQSYEEASGISITLREFPAEGLRTQYVNAVRSNSGAFDLFQLDEPYVGEFFGNEWVQPLAGVRDGFALDPQTVTYADLVLWDQAAQASATNGTLMGLPLSGNVHLLVYRKDLYEDLGLDVPTTWEQALRNGQQAQDAGAVEFGYAPRCQPTPGAQSISYDFLPVFYSYGADWFADPGTDWTPTVNSPEAVEAASMYREFAELGPSATTTIGQAEVIALVQSGRTLQTHIVAAAAPEFLDPEASEVADTIGFAKLPAGPAGQTPVSGTWTLAIPAGMPEERASAVLDFIEWLGGADQQRAFMEAGGIPNRTDVLEGDLPEESAAYLEPYAAMIGGDLRPCVRFPFATPMLEQTEPILSSIAAGDADPQAGMDELQAALTGIVRDAGVLD